jgi:hypothetical protein
MGIAHGALQAKMVLRTRRKLPAGIEYRVQERTQSLWSPA